MFESARAKNREVQIKEACEDTKYSFVGWESAYKNAYSKFTCHCEDHGDWGVSVHNFINGGRRCPGCQKQKTSERCRSDELEVIARINHVRPGYSFQGWVADFKGTKSKFWCRCPHHGNWVVSPLHYLYQGTGCPSCAGLKPYTQPERENQLRGLCQRDGFSFLGWSGLYKNSNSRFLYMCTHHGVIEASINTFINGGRRCAGCAVSGFRPDKKGFLYLLSAEGRLKVGITNNIESRIRILSRVTPFSFSLLRHHSAEGTSVRELEKYFHSKFASAGLTGFDGATEWLTFNPEIIDEFSQLELNQCPI